MEILILDINGEDFVVLLPHPSGQTKFRSIVVQPFVEDCQQQDDPTPTHVTPSLMIFKSTHVVLFEATLLPANNVDPIDDELLTWKSATL